MSDQDRTEQTPMTADELRSALADSTRRMKQLQAEEQTARDQYRAGSETWRYHDGRVRAFALSLDALFSWTRGEFGEEFEAGA